MQRTRAQVLTQRQTDSNVHCLHSPPTPPLAPPTQVDGEDDFRRVGGSPIGGGTYWGLLKLLTDWYFGISSFTCFCFRSYLFFHVLSAVSFFAVSFLLLLFYCFFFIVSFAASYCFLLLYCCCLGLSGIAGLLLVLLSAVVILLVLVC